VLYLVRHGRTDANAKGLLQGRLDPPLDEVGRKQAEAIAALIGDVDEVISSPLLRARQTAAFFDRDVVVDDAWIELAYGEYEGVPAGEVPPEVWQSWKTNAMYATKGGESFGALDARVREVCESLGATMDIMFHCHLGQASLCRVDKGRFGPLLHTFNEQATVDPY